MQSYLFTLLLLACCCPTFCISVYGEVRVNTTGSFINAGFSCFSKRRIHDNKESLEDEPIQHYT